MPQAPPAWWSLPEAALLEALGTGPGGLDPAEAARRLARTGPNAVVASARLGALRLLLRQVESPLILILVFAALLSLLLAQWIDAGVILAIVAGSAALGFVQEWRASRAVEALRRRLALSARVLRGGREETVPVTELVPGDILLLSAGNLVPADGRVLEARDFLVTEAAMTGESFPVEKRPGLVAAAAPLAARTNAVFLGSSVRSGRARVVVAATGRATAFGATAARLAERPGESDFGRGVRRFGYLLLRVMVVIVLAVLLASLLLGRPPVESLLFAVALAVGLSPELLPAIVTITLASGARRMARRGVIVRRLDSIESLGSMAVLCTDKTGTLTEGRIVLARATDPGGAPSAEVLRLSFLNAALETGIENPLDAAITAAGAAAGFTAEGLSKIDEIPYDFIRRRLTIVIEDPGAPGDHLIITKGAFAEVLEACTHVAGPEGPQPLDEARRAELARRFEAGGRAGFRLLALATRSVPRSAIPARADYGREEEAGLTFRGFLVFEDPARADAARTLAALAARGIAVKIVSGDNRHVTAHLAREVGLDPQAILTGSEIAEMGEEALWHRAPRTDLFVEIDPQQKERIVRALQRGGQGVGYLGDGINDAPALMAADVGISVEGAVDVARESADIVLTAPDLAVLLEGVAEGRRSFANTLKYIAITTSANFGNMVSMAVATPFLPFLPLAPKQILLNNFLSDLPSTAIAGDRVDAARLARPQAWSIAGIRRFMILFGLLSSVFDLLTFGFLLLLLEAGEAEFQTVWFMVSLLSEVAVVFVLRTEGPFWRSRPGGLLLAASVAVGVLALAVPWLGGLSAAFGFLPLPPGALLAVLGIVAAYIAATEAAKRWFFGRARAAAAPGDPGEDGPP